MKTIAVLPALLLAACAGSDGPADYGDPTRSDPNALFLRVDEPDDFTESSDANIPLRGVAAAAADVPTVTAGLAVGGQFPIQVQDGAFDGTISLVHGENRITIVARLPDGTRADAIRNVLYNGSPPGLAWVAPGGGLPVGGAKAHVTLQVSVSSGRNLSSVRLDAGAGAVSATADTTGRYVADVPLPQSGDTVSIVATARDSAGEETATQRTFPRDPAPPTITITTPTNGQVLESSGVDISGTAADDVGLLRVEVRVGNAAPEPATGTSSWTVHLSLDPGPQTLTATAWDLSGQKAEVTINVSVARVISLRPPATGGDLTLTLDKNGLKQLITADDQKSITLLYVDLEPLLTSGLEAIKDPVASGLDTSAWGTAERNMQRLLNMSPDNANLSGTVLEPVLTLAPNIGLPPARLLAEIAGVNVTDPFLASSEVSQAILRNVINTHPNMDTDPADGKKKLRESLYDAIEDCTTLAPRFGPVGNHPGFLTGTTYAAVLKANFAMTVTARSNLAQHDGINPAVGKAFLFVPVDASQSTILEFDFLDPNRFKVEGIPDDPTVDMTFFMNEYNGFIASGTLQNARPDNGFFQGNSAAWTINPWLIEHLLVDAVYTAKHARFPTENYQHTFTYAVGAINPAATVVWNKGWITMTTAGGLGNPPAPAYFWDYLLEAGQRRLHDQGVAEGAGNVRFTLNRIPLGMTGDELKAKLRPQMEAQKDDLSRILLGDRNSYSSTAAFFRARGTEGGDYLYFTAPTDVPGMTYPYTKPGFFRDAALTQKASTVNAGTSGDTAHEKVSIQAGATYYVRGADGLTYKISLVDFAASNLRIRVEAVR